MKNGASISFRLHPYRLDIIMEFFIYGNVMMRNSNFIHRLNVLIFSQNFRIVEDSLMFPQTNMILAEDFEIMSSGNTVEFPLIGTKCSQTCGLP